MKKGIIGLLVTMLLIVVVLTGCSSTTTTTTATTTATSTTTATTTATSTTTATTNAPAAWVPNKPITIIVGAGAGGGFDTYSRAVAEYMGKILGVSVVVQNVPGAGGLTGFMQAYRSKPDGYTLTMVDTEKRISESIVATQDYDFSKVVWIGGVHQYYSLIGVAGNSPINNAADLVAAFANKPIKIACQDVGVVEAVFPLVMGLTPQYVSGYSGSQDSILGVIKGDADAVVYPDTTMLPFIQSGDLKGILYMALTNSAVMDANGISVPNASQDYPGLAGLVNTRALALPPGTPANIQDTLEAALMEALNSPEMAEWAKTTSHPINAITVADLQAAFQRQIDVYTKYKDVLAEYIS